MFWNYQKIKNILIEDCRHYRGYRYGLHSNNIYEDYICAMEQKIDIKKTRLEFIDRIIGTRSFDFFTTLGLNSRNKYNNWDYPWNFLKNSIEYSACSNPDIICHTSTDGICASHINREFNWLEKAYSSIKTKGYLPDKYGYIKLLQLNKGKKVSYIVLDGNHRIASLAVLGETNCKAIVVNKFILRYSLSFLWSGYLLRNYTKKDAQAIFLRYFQDINQEIKQSKDYSSIIFDEELLVNLVLKDKDGI